MSGTQARILIVDDDEQIADILSIRLEAEGYKVDSCGTVARALDLMARNRYSLVLLDLRLRDGNGVESLPRFRDVDGEVPIFIITAHGDVDSAVQAFSSGANGYIRKPFQDGDLKLQIAQAIEAYETRLEVRRLRGLIGADESGIGRVILARDPLMRRFLEQVRIAAASSSNVVIYGESGTGKELVARALHELGARNKGPFVAINCGAFPETLLESELFGHMRGAFTDARENKAGHIVRASSGTLFLDEIGDAPLSIQVRLLRVLQEREVLPLGANAPIKVDVRFIAATHRDPKALVAEGKFREDLFYRLQVLPLHVPPLRSRPADIGYLASVFAGRFAARHGKGFEGFTESAVSAMQAYSWPGNVRELQNRVEHAIVMGRSSMVTTPDLFPEGFSRAQEKEGYAAVPELPAPASGADAPTGATALAGGASVIRPYREAKEEFDRRYLEHLLTIARGNITQAAKLAGKYRTEVYGMIRKYQVDPREFKG